VASTEQCYKYNRSEDRVVNITVNYPPNILNETVNNVTQGASAQFGSLWNFSVLVKDPDGNDVNVSLMVDYGSGFVEVAKQTCTACSDWKEIVFSSWYFDCTKRGTNYYRFDAVDSISNTNATSSHFFTVNKDSLSFLLVQGNNSIADTTGETTTKLVVLVSNVNGTNITDGSRFNVSVTNDGAATWVSVENQTNSTGHLILNFNATCDYSVGRQFWKASLDGARATMPSLRTAMCSTPP